MRIVTTDRGYVPMESNGSKSFVVDVLPGSWPAFFGTSWKMRRRLADIVRQVDVVHLHSLYLFHDWVGAHYCWRFERPYIVRPHGTLDPYIFRRHRWRKAFAEVLFQRRVLRRAAGLHYTARDEWLLARPHAENSRGCVIPIGVDLRALDNLPPRRLLRERYPIIGERKVVLFLGRLSFKKGLDVVVSAFANIARERQDVFLVIAGPDDGILADVTRQIEEHGIKDRTLFTGMVSGREKHIILAGSDCFLLPSLSENFGITVVEAAACGMPVVISDRVNLWREFYDAGAALVGRPQVVDFIAHLRFLLENPTQAAQIGKRGVDLVRRNFEWGALGSRYEAMYSLAARTGALCELREDGDMA